MGRSSAAGPGQARALTGRCRSRRLTPLPRKSTTSFFTMFPNLSEAIVHVDPSGTGSDPACRHSAPSRRRSALILSLVPTIRSLVVRGAAVDAEAETA